MLFEDNQNNYQIIKRIQLIMKAIQWFLFLGFDFHDWFVLFQCLSAMFDFSFLVFDGHAGGRVSAHCSHHLLDCIRLTQKRRKLNWSSILPNLILSLQICIRVSHTELLQSLSHHEYKFYVRASDEFTCSLQQEHSLTQEEVRNYELLYAKCQFKERCCILKGKYKTQHMAW